MRAIKRFFAHPVFLDKRFVVGLWAMVALLAVIKQWSRGVNNNFLIFRYVFDHTVEQVNLYAPYADQYYDVNHYGPVFSLLIAPFALLPVDWGVSLWIVFVAFALLFAVYKLPLSWQVRAVVLYLLLHKMYATLIVTQTNALIAALIIGSFIAIRKEKDLWAAFFIVLGTFVKLYGIVGLAFFFFSRHKLKLLLYILLWSVVLFVLPMVISSPQFIIQSYADWYDSLVGKNIENLGSTIQDISVMGMLRRISGVREMSNMLVLIPAVILFALQYIRRDRYSNPAYQLGILSSTLLAVVLFSSGSEPNTYVIAMAGVAIWFVSQPRPYSKFVVALLIFVLVVSDFSASDLMPKYIRFHVIRAYSLQALPCLIVWLVLWKELCTIGGRKNDAAVGKHTGS